MLQLKTVVSVPSGSLSVLQRSEAAEGTSLTREEALVLLLRAIRMPVNCVNASASESLSSATSIRQTEAPLLMPDEYLDEHKTNHNMLFKH